MYFLFIISYRTLFETRWWIHLSASWPKIETSPQQDKRKSKGTCQKDGYRKTELIDGIGRSKKRILILLSVMNGYECSKTVSRGKRKYYTSLFGCYTRISVLFLSIIKVQVFIEPGVIKMECISSTGKLVGKARNMNCT